VFANQPKIFLSHARQDLNVVKKLAQALQAQGYSVWYDQESVYGGQSWPKTIGEAIADHDMLLLVWSEHASQAHFVEFEWSTAIALRKTILPYLLDDTPLSAYLSIFHGILQTNLEDDLTKIVLALQRSRPETEPKQTSRVMEKLSELKASQPENAIKAVKETIKKQITQVRGNVYQAGRDVIITRPQKEEKSWLQRWQVWAAVVTAAVALIATIPKIVDEYGRFFPAKTAVFSGSVHDTDGRPLNGAVLRVQGKRGEGTTDSTGNFHFEIKAGAGRQIWVTIKKDGRVGFDDYVWLSTSVAIPFDITYTPIEQTLSGMIVDETNIPLDDVIVYLPEFDEAAITDLMGRFEFHVKGGKQKPVKIISQKAGYLTYVSYATLGNPSLNFVMRGKE